LPVTNVAMSRILDVISDNFKIDQLPTSYTVWKRFNAAGARSQILISIQCRG